MGYPHHQAENILVYLRQEFRLSGQETFEAPRPFWFLEPAT